MKETHEHDIKQEVHSLRDWQEILANDSALMEEFEALTPPKPIH